MNGNLCHVELKSEEDRKSGERLESEMQQEFSRGEKS